MLQRPNILFVLADQHRGDWLEGPDLALRTPEMNRLAREGARFTGAICPSPLCSPSRASLATSLNYDRIAVKSNADDLPDHAPTFYQVLRTAGYGVYTCGKLDLFKSARSWGADGLHRRSDGSSKLDDAGFTGGFDAGGKHDAVLGYTEGVPEPFSRFLQAHGLANVHAADYAARPSPNYVNLAPSPLPEFAYGDNWIGATALRLMTEAVAAGKPWFIQVNFFGPHEPLDVPQVLIDRWSAVTLPVPDTLGRFSAGQHVDIRRRYAAMIENIDTWMGTFRRVLENLDAARETIIVYASDHGDMLGDKGYWAKTYPFQPSIGVPLIVSGAGVRPGQLRSEPISLVDLGPTFTALANARPGWDHDGESFVDLLRGAPERSDSHRLSGFGAWRAVTDGRFKLVAGFDEANVGKATRPPAFDKACLGNPDRMLLFDVIDDPGESHNLVRSDPERARRLAERLQDALSQSTT